MGISTIGQGQPVAQATIPFKKLAVVEKEVSQPAPAPKKDEAIISDKAKDLAAATAGQAAAEDANESASARSREAQGV